MWLLSAIYNHSSVSRFFPVLYIYIYIYRRWKKSRERRVDMHVTMYIICKQSNSLQENSSIFIFFYLFSVFRIDTRLRAEPFDVRISEGTRAFFRSPKLPDQLCGSLCIVFNRYQGSFPGLKQAGSDADHSPP